MAHNTLKVGQQIRFNVPIYDPEDEDCKVLLPAGSIGTITHLAYEQSIVDFPEGVWVDLYDDYFGSGTWEVVNDR